MVQIFGFYKFYLSLRRVVVHQVSFIKYQVMSPVKKNSPVSDLQAQTSKKSDNRTLAIIFAAVLVLVAAGYFAYPFLKNLLFPPPQIIVVEEPPVIPVEEPAEIFQEPLPSIPSGYYIIIGSFRDKNRADLMVDNLKNVNLVLETLHFENIGAYRISAGRYDNIHVAYNETVKVMDILSTANVWVLENIY